MEKNRPENEALYAAAKYQFLSGWFMLLFRYSLSLLYVIYIVASFPRESDSKSAILISVLLDTRIICTKIEADEK